MRWHMPVNRRENFHVMVFELQSLQVRCESASAVPTILLKYVKLSKLVNMLSPACISIASVIGQRPDQLLYSGGHKPAD